MTNAGRPRRPTIRDVAAASGVSRGTVSRVLNGGHWVSPDALAAVQEAIERTGYKVNHHARSLATRRSNSVAFLLAEKQHLLFDDPNIAVLLRGAAAALGDRDLSLILMTAGTTAERKRATDFIMAGHVDGVLLISSHLGSPLLRPLLEARIPTVSCGRPLGFENKLSYVTADDRGGARQLTAHLLGTGRRRIATITGPLDTSGGRERLAGYRDALGGAYDEDLVVRGDYSRSSGYAGMQELLRRNDRVDAVFAANDRMAAGAMAALRDAGLQVPSDIAVGGFDDTDLAAAVEPSLTTVRLPFERMSIELVRLLLEVIDGQQGAATILPTTLVQRESA
ncbi:substrate-binding domain-containing protein [Jiangella gansuensis]|uniref:substrate-binding domain-containing protein n=1 Tax=Jiangella gansuensis TaxID=281473 RepID=UPI00047C3A84